VKVNAIAAGIFDTDLAQAFPIVCFRCTTSGRHAGRLGRPEELAEYAAFMVSERNSFMNGEVVIVDGGAIT
jgi:3-oxoacyl-[acyl-carrier protein] reductase